MKTLGKIISFAAAATVLTKLTRALLKKQESKKATSNVRAAKAANSQPSISKKNQSAQLKNQPVDNSTDQQPRKQTIKSNQSDLGNQKMYKDLEMTEDQKKRYEADYKKLMSGWDQENPGTPIDEKEKFRRNDSALKAVLNEDQYAMYRE